MVLAVVLAAADVPDTSIRIPGTALRLGTDIARYGASEGFSPGAGGSAERVLREGPVRFYGVESRAALAFEGQQLVQAEFTVEDASRRLVDYIEDDLARRGYHRRCEQHDTAARRCDWSGRASVRFEVAGTRLFCRIGPPAPRVAPAPAPPAAHLSPAVRATVDTLADTLALDHRPAENALPPPELVERAQPVFPAPARQARLQGVVHTVALVDTSGTVLDARILRGIAELDDAALECVKRYRFRPYVVEGRARRFWVEVPVTFVLF